MSDVATAIAEQQEALPQNTEAPEPIQIEITAEGEKKPETEAEPKKRPGRPPANIIISGLKNQNSELLTANERLMAELEVERRARDAAEKKASASTFQNMALHESKLKAEAENARKAYVEHANAQDFAKQAEAAAALARAEAGLADVDAWKAQNPAPEKKPEPEQRREVERPQQQPGYDPASEQWVNQNSWFSPMVGGRPNPEFNKVMHLTAVAYATRLEAELQAQGKGDQVAKPEYFAKIDQYMRDQFPGEMGDEEAVVEETPAPKTTVAPVVRTQMGASKTPSKNVITLSAEERQFVDGMRNSGAMLYPQGHKEAGKRMSPTDSYVAYWRQKQAGAN